VYVLTGVEGVASGHSRIREQTAAQLRTGQSEEKSRSSGEFPVFLIETDVAEFEEFCTWFAGGRSARRSMPETVTIDWTAVAVTRWTRR
jgi:hypothetical protein